MRNFLWVLLLGLSALAAAQDANRKTSTSTVIHLITQPYNRVKHRGAEQEYLAAIAQLAEVSPEAQSEPEESPVEDKAAQGILEAVSAVVGSFRPSFPSFHSADEAPPTETSEAVSTDDSAVVEAAEANVTEATVAVTTVVDEVTDVVLSKKEQKAVNKYNEATDKLLVVLAKKMQTIDSFPIQVDEAALLALDQASTVETDETQQQAGNTRNNNKNGNKNKRKNKKNKKNKKRNNKRKNRDGLQLREEDEEEVEEVEEEEEGRGKNKNSNENSAGKKNKKNKNRSNENGDNDSNEKKKKKKNKKGNKNKGNRNNKKNKKNASRRNRQPKAMDDDEDDALVLMGRRKGGQPINMRKKNNNMHNNKQNQRQGNRGKNKNKNKNKNRKNKNKGRSEVEAREEMGPVMPTNEERSSSNARLTGLSNLVRDGDVTVDLDGKKHKIHAQVTVGPLKVNLKDKSRTLKRAEVSTNLDAVIKLKVKTVARRSKISVGDVQVMELTPEEVAVIRSDLDLQPDVITSAQEKVVSAIDTERLGRVLKAQLEEILDKDDILENLENHPLLRN